MFPHTFLAAKFDLQLMHSIHVLPVELQYFLLPMGLQYQANLVCEQSLWFLIAPLHISHKLTEPLRQSLHVYLII